MMPAGAPVVAEFLQELEHPMKDGILKLRTAILASDDEITDHIKWNAPSFCYHGEDRVTFRLQPGDRLQLVLHRGAKVRDDSADFVSEDAIGLIEWSTPDRGTVTLRDLDEVDAELPRVVELVGRWMHATA